MGGVAAYAVERIGAKLLAGHLPRSDGFFERRQAKLSPAEELFEGVLLKARNEYEERKLRHEAIFFANLAFAEQVSPQTAHVLLKSLDRLTYRQLCILAFVGERGTAHFEALRKHSHPDSDLEALKREEIDLHESDLGSFGLIRGISSWTDTLSTLGNTLYTLAGLDEVPVEARTAIGRILERLQRQYPSTEA